MRIELSTSGFTWGYQKHRPRWRGGGVIQRLALFLVEQDLLEHREFIEQ